MNDRIINEIKHGLAKRKFKERREDGSQTVKLGDSEVTHFSGSEDVALFDHDELYEFMVQSHSKLEEQFVKHRMQSNVYTPEQTADYLNSLPEDMRILLTSAATHVTVTRHIMGIMVDKIREHDDDEEPSSSLN